MGRMWPSGRTLPRSVLRDAVPVASRNNDAESMTWCFNKPVWATAGNAGRVARWGVYIAELGVARVRKKVVRHAVSVIDVEHLCARRYDLGERQVIRFQNHKAVSYTHLTLPTKA